MTEELRYAQRLAIALWETHWKAGAPDWKPLPDVMGVLTQLDNMTSGLSRVAQRAPLFPMAECERIANEEFDRQVKIIESATNDKALSETGRASILAIADSAALTAQRIASRIRALSALTSIPNAVPSQGTPSPVEWEDIARQLFAVDGCGFWEDRTPLQEEAYTIRAKAVAALYTSSVTSSNAPAAQRAPEPLPADGPEEMLKSIATLMEQIEMLRDAVNAVLNWYGNDRLIAFPGKQLVEALGGTDASALTSTERK